MSPVRRLATLRERDFRLLWLGQTASEFGSALVPVALTFAVLDLTSSATSLGLVLVAAFVPRIVLLLIAGVVADRFARRPIMLVSDALRAVTQALVALLLLSGQARLWELVLLFVAYGAADAFFSPAATGLVPEVTATEHLQQANGLLSFSRSATTVVGPGLAGVLIAGSAPGVVFVVDALTFVVSSVSLALLRAPRSSPTVRATTVATDLRDGWHEVSTRSWVWTSIVFFSVSNLAVAPLYVLGPLVAQQSLGGPAAWGLIASGAGVGLLLGDLAAIAFRPRRALVPGYLALTSWGLAPALLARPFPAVVVAAAGAVGFAALSFSNAVWLTVLQERIPRQSLSRVSAYDWLGSRLFQPLGYALAGPVGGAIGIPATLLAGAAMQASASVAIAFVPAVRKLKTH